MISGLYRLHAIFVGLMARALARWFPGLAARAIFSSVLFVYFMNSAMTKIGEGPLGFLHPSVGAYAQILPTLMEKVSYDTSQIAFFPYGLIVLLGTWAEFVLPALIAAGLFTRLASLGFLVFIAVMTFADITGHHVEAATIGGFFDRAPDAPIADQRLLWTFPLIYLTIFGAGAISLDAVLARRQRERMRGW